MVSTIPTPSTIETGMSSLTESESARPSRARRTPKVSGDDRERAILTTFERLLEESSWHEISIDEIARGAGISRSSFYFYFASKEAVLLSLFERMLTEAAERRGAMAERVSKDPAAHIREGLSAFFDVFRAHRAVTLAGADARTSSAEVRAVWAQVMEAWVQETAADIEAERARGAAPEGVPARELAISLLLMNERVQYTALSGHSPAVDEDQVVDVLSAIWLNAIYGTASPAGVSSAS
jgi:AcrR family transcriptional regulator